MARRYIRVVIEMIAEAGIEDREVIETVFRDDVIAKEDFLEPGEVNVKVEIHGEVVVRDNGYAIPWVE